MAVEAVDARHEVMLCLERARLAVEAGSLHQAETHAQSAIAWLHEVSSAQGLDGGDVSPESGWTYRP